jgi:LAS superfamily LD-carboxypeptidase LdcB
MKKAFFTLIATVALISSSSLFAMDNNENIQIENKKSGSKKAIEVTENIKDPVPVPGGLTQKLLQQIIEDGYFNTEMGMFKLMQDEREEANSMLPHVNTQNPASTSFRSGNLVFRWSEGWGADKSYSFTLVKEEK